MIEAVIFDWAGTTVDFGCFAPVDAFVQAFKAFGITPTLEEVRKPMGILKKDHVRTMLQMERISSLWRDVYGREFTEEDVQAVYEKSEKAILEAVVNYAAPKPFAVETVAKLREKGIKIGSTTGYTKDMMAIVAPKAKELGYAPDCYFTPDMVGGVGRPYPYMVFQNLQALGVSAVGKAIKVGDTVADIKEGKAAGMISVGILDGSSVMGISQEEFEDLSPDQLAEKREAATAVYQAAGADHILTDLSQLEKLIATM